MYCLLIACKVVVVVVKFRYWVGLWDAKYGHEEYHTKLFIVLTLKKIYILLIMCFFMIVPLQTLVYLTDCIQCKNSQVLKATLSVLTCEVYHPDSVLTNLGCLFLLHS